MTTTNPHTHNMHMYIVNVPGLHRRCSTSDSLAGISDLYYMETVAICDPHRRQTSVQTRVLRSLLRPSTHTRHCDSAYIHTLNMVHCIYSWGQTSSCTRYMMDPFCNQTVEVVHTCTLYVHMQNSCTTYRSSHFWYIHAPRTMREDETLLATSYSTKM